MKVLIGEISSYKAIIIAKYLQNCYNNIDIITYDVNKTTSAIHTKYSDNHFVLKYEDVNSYLIRPIKISKIKKN